MVVYFRPDWPKPPRGTRRPRPAADRAAFGCRRRTREHGGRQHHALFTRIDQRAREFCLIRSYLQTASKHGICWLDALADAMRGHPLDAHHRNRLTRISNSDQARSQPASSLAKSPGRHMVLTTGAPFGRSRVPVTWKTEVLVERHVFRFRRFEVGGQPLLIASPEPRAQQGCADPVSLPDRIDPDEGQIPMRLFARDGRGPPRTDTAKRLRDDGRRLADNRGGRNASVPAKWCAGREPHGGSGYASIDIGQLPLRRDEATHGAVRR